MKKLKIKIAFPLIALSMLPIAMVFAEAPRPNIVIILCDDLGYSDVGFNGATDIITPQLDSLAKQGTIFTSAYVAHPFCGPSRASIMTGRYAHPLGAQFNLPSYTKSGIDVHEPYFSSLLQEAGYQTGLIGKWHLGEEPEYQPNNRGFDYFYGMLGGGHDYFTNTFFKSASFDPASRKEGQYDYHDPLRLNNAFAPETGYENNLYITDMFTEYGIKFIEDAEAEDDKPFLLFMSYNAPHTPLEAKTEDIDYLLDTVGFTYPDTEDGLKRKTYAAMVYAVDRNVARLIDMLKAKDEYDNTLIVFFSDNGGKLTAGATNTPLRGGKGNSYEGGFRVPMFLHWPNSVPVGKTNDYPISALDLYPTFARLAGAEIPNCKRLDGKDIWDSFMADTNLRPGELIYSLRHRANANEIGVRSDQWKIYRNTGDWKLYNLDDDKAESKDLSGTYPLLLDSLVAKARPWTTSHAEPLWFDSPKVHDNWYLYNMPHFEESFGPYEAGDTIYPDTTWKPCAAGNIAVTDLAISPKTSSLLIGETSHLLVSIVPKSATNQEVIWTSSDVTIATVNDTGLVEAVAKGVAIITAKSIENNDIYSTATITVTQETNSVSTNIHSGNVLIYPNPIQSELNIKFSSWHDGLVQVSIFDIQGRTLQTMSNMPKKYNNLLTLKLNPEISSGIYFLNLKSASGSLTKNIVVSR